MEQREQSQIYLSYAESWQRKTKVKSQKWQKFKLNTDHTDSTDVFWWNLMFPKVFVTVNVIVNLTTDHTDSTDFFDVCI